MEEGFEKLRLEIKNRMAHVTLNDPPHNFLSHQMMSELGEVMEILTAERDLCAVLFTASGGSFSSGFDYSEHSREIVFSLTEKFRNIGEYLLNLDIPSVALVQGHLKNWACDLLYFFDVVIADGRTVFQYDNLSFGSFPPFGSLFIPERIGYPRALSLLLYADEFSTGKARELGMITREVAFDPAAGEAGHRDRVTAELRKILATLNSKSTAVLGIMLQNLRRGKKTIFQSHADDVFNDYLNVLADMEDYNEGIAAWTEKRSPEWKNQ